MSSQRFYLADDRERALAAAEAAVAAGGCIVLPTDTVYGIGADAFDRSAVAKVLAAKGRGRDMPVPVLIGAPDVLEALGSDLPSAARHLAADHWPGALTLIVRAQASLALDLGDTGGTIAVRMPDHPDALELLRRTGPLAVSSANVTGQDPATDCADAQRQLGDAVAVYLDGGPTPGPIPSTIVDLVGTATIRREGAITAADLRRTVAELA